MNLESAPVASHAKFLHRTLHLLQMVKYQLDWELQSEYLPEGRRKKLTKYRDNFIGWVYRDLITSTPNTQASDLVQQEMNSEWAKDMTLWMDIGLDCKNLSEVMEVILKCKDDGE